VTDRLLAVTWGATVPQGKYEAKVLEVIQRVVADEMMAQASNGDNSPQVRAVLADRLHRLGDRLRQMSDPSPHQRLVAADIGRWENRPESTVPGPALLVAPGDPIGGSSRN